jgi:hypothetical protein
MARSGGEALARYEHEAAVQEQRRQELAAVAGWAERAASLVTAPKKSCWTRALTDLKAFDCRGLGTDGHRRLALAIAACTHESAGKGGLPCNGGASMEQCGKKLTSDQWTSFEHAQRDVTAVCFATQLDLMTHNFSAHLAASASAMLDGITAIAAVQQQQLVTQLELQHLQERALERQEAYVALSSEQLALSQASTNALQQMSANMKDTA